MPAAPDSGAARGRFFVLEGPEGAGKSTQAERLAAWLRDRGQVVVVTREPGGTRLGEEIRRLLLAPDGCAILPQSEALLYAAARAQHVGELILPALGRGETVVSDRFVDSSIAYQAGGRRLPLDQVLAVQRLATQGLEPDLRILLDLPVEEGLRRRREGDGEWNRIDGERLAFHRRVRAEYRRLAADRPEAWLVVDAAQPVDRVTEAIIGGLSARLTGAAVAGGGARAAGSSE